MRVLSSLSSRLLLGAVLWTIGLLAASLLIANELFYRHREWPRVMHNSAFDHVHLFMTLSVVSLAGGFLAIRSGLLSLGQLRARLAAVHAGKDRRLEGTHPAEIQPLVNDLNALIDHQDQMVRRALACATAGRLACKRAVDAGRGAS